MTIKTAQHHIVPRGRFSWGHQVQQRKPYTIDLCTLWMKKGKFFSSTKFCVGTVLCFVLEMLRDFIYPSRRTLILPGIKLESKAQARLSVVLPVHWLPTGNKRMHWRTRSCMPDESHSDHSDHSDQLSAMGIKTHTHTVAIKCFECTKMSHLPE